MVQFMIRVDTLFLQVISDSAEERGLNELVENGYADDMREMWAPVYLGSKVENMELVEAELDTAAAKDFKTVQMAVWSHGRLYDSTKATVFQFKYVAGWWAELDETAEWL